MINDSKEEEIIATFLADELPFNWNSPKFLTNNEECIKASIDRNIDSLYFVTSISPEIESYVISRALETGYVLHKSSHEILKTNYEIIKNSINLDVRSANYVDWKELESSISAEELDELIDLVVEKGYVLRTNSPDYLCKSYDVVKNSISLDVTSADYVDWYTLGHSISEEEKNELINTLVQKGYVLHRNSPNYLRRFYKLIKNIIKLKVSNANNVDWNWLVCSNNAEEIDELIDILVEKGYILNWNSPVYLWGIYKLVKNSISLDVKSVDCVNWGKVDYTSTSKAMDELIDILIEKGYVLDRYSPDYLGENYKLAKASIDIDVKNVDYVHWESLEENNTKEEMDELIDILKKKGYVLHKNSPDYLCRSYELAKTSIDIDVNSADCVHWNKLVDLTSDEEMDELINLVSQKGYVLHRGSPNFLRNNAKIVLNSIKVSINNAQYASSEALRCPEIFQYAGLHGFKFGWDFLKNVPIDRFNNMEIFSNCYDSVKGYKSNNELYRDRIDSLYSSVLNSCPTIDIYENVFSAIAIDRWEKHKRENANQLVNLFGKISSELRNSTNFEKSIYNLDFLVKMKEILKDKYDDLYSAMKEYYDIYHSDVEDKLDKMQPSQDKISYYAALYCGKRKDNFIKETISECHTWLKNFFVLRLDNSTVDKKLIQPKRKNKFRELYQDNNEEVIGFIGSIIQKYSQELDKDTIQRLIEGFVLEDKAKLSEIIEEPNNYDAYLKYEKVGKLIKRLNQGYISFEGPEVKKYLDIIGFDKEKGLYVYTGVSFSDIEKDEILKYKRISKISEMIKKDISIKIKEMNIELEIIEEEIKKLAEKLPFTDEYFEFDKKFLSRITMGQFCWGATLYAWDEATIKNDDSYDLAYNVLIEQGLMWLLILLQYDDYSILTLYGIYRDEIEELVVNAPNLIKLAKELNIDLKSFDKVRFLTNISLGADLRSIDILGLDIVEKLSKELGFTSGNRKKIVSRAERLVSKMVGRSMSTVPYVSGETMNYKYSLYDSQDVDVLLAGINTDACFRVCGNDNDFLHYCCLDKNGFVIKITDKEGNFVARAGGFRNGNCVFLNQLRTIYDRNGNYYRGQYENENKEIIETLKKACIEIVRTSQENDLESDKIDYVFVTRSYSLRETNTLVPVDIENKIGIYPMETDSQDWEDFIDDNYSVLYISKSSKGFTTDYNNYRIICMASTEFLESMKVDDLKFGDVEALYERTRNKIIATTNIDSNVLRKIKKINGINSYLNQEEYKEVIIPDSSTVFVGDNWYLVYANGKIVSSCVLEFDEKAKREFSLVQDSIDRLTSEMIQQQLEDAQLLLDLQNNEADSGYSLKKVNESSIKPVV